MRFKLHIAIVSASIMIAFMTPSVALAANKVSLNPSFSALISTVNGFTVKVNNYNPAYTFTSTVSVGKVKGTKTGKTLVLNITGLTAGQSAKVTVKVTRKGYTTKTAAITGTTLATGSAPSGKWKQISAGQYSTCGVSASGGAYCWGSIDYYAQLGKNSTTHWLAPIAVTGLSTGVASIETSGIHTCAVTTSGAAYCWGNNQLGQLGNNSTTDSGIPVAVTGLTSGVASISVGGNDSCAVTTSGAAYCWGFNYRGELGNNSTIDSSVPVAVTGLTSGVASISVGGLGACAVTISGAAYCWGNNGFGQLGNNSTTDSLVPVVVTGLTSGVASISAGGTTCAVTTSGAVYCWGWNGEGELGINSTTDSLVPVAVTGLTSGVASISAGWTHVCALMASGKMYCWGSLNYGYQGFKDTTASLVPAAISGLLSGVASISEGADHTCAVTVAGTAYCFDWGLRDARAVGELGNNSTAESVIPVLVADPMPAALTPTFSTPVSTANGFTVNVTNYDPTYTFMPTIDTGAVAKGTASASTLPLTVTGLDAGNSATLTVTVSRSGYATVVAGVDGSVPQLVTWIQLSTAGSYTCGVTISGAAYCWGSNAYGQLGDNSTTDSLVPVAVSGLSSGVASISVGGLHACAVTTSGAAYCWGAAGQLGDNGVPAAVTGLPSGVASISAGVNHSCAVITSGAAYCWGDNSAGQLGNNSTTNSSVPVAVTGFSSGVASITAGFNYSCAVTTSGAAYCWGFDSAGQLGNNSTTNSSVPAAVSGFSSGVASITAGVNYSCAVTTSGAAYCWGFNGAGQLGSNTTSSSPVPEAVFGLSSGVASISAGVNHSCAVITSGAAYCWGLNNSGQLGNNSNTFSPVPVAVSGFSSQIASISEGQVHSCAVTTSGAAYCWGDNSAGQLGNNTKTESLVPVLVTNP
jgi:alpha-tubulin suppressor-like RCC1 family protein